MDYIVASNTNFLDNLTKLVSDKIHLHQHTELVDKQIPLSLDNKIYVPHEDALDAILTRSQDPLLSDGVIQLKDKYLFRQLMKKVDPDYFFEVVNRIQLSTLKLPDNQKFVLKPRRGFFGTAVHFIDSTTDLEKLSGIIDQELKANGEYFSSTTLSTEEFILEEFIEGEEYAVDMFYNSKGEPIITNITHHPLAQKQAYFHSIYYTSKTIFDQFHDKFITFFKEFNQKVNLRNFPIHAEFKGTPNSFKPIEMNPLRFGGFGLADLTYHSTGLNPFKAFFSDESINWNQFWDSNPDDLFAWVLGYKGTEIIDTEVIPDHQAFKTYLGDIISYTAIDHLTNPVFALAYIKLKDIDVITKIKDTEFNNFFVSKN